ncbi:MAG: tetratricopeptide (TPR) repeat protein [Planctomycetota bacterium]|jgi:tetratricopeptide (TPR) repeat protein
MEGIGKTPHQDPGNSRGSLVLAALVLLLGCALIYGRVGGFDFVLFDDDAYVYNNEMVSGGVTAESLNWALTESHSNNWHPLTWVSHMLDVEVFGLEPGGHHWVSVGLHGFAAVLLLLLCGRLGLGPAAAFLVAALFAWHPLRVESVAWISERKDVLSALFGFLTLHAYLSFSRGRDNGAKTALWAAVVLFSFGLGLLAKPMLVTLPAVLLLLDYWPLRSGDGTSKIKLSPLSLLLEKLPLFALAIGSALLTVVIQSKSGAVQGFESIPLLPRIENALWSILVYPAQTLAPLKLAVLYPHPALVGGGALLHSKALAALAVIAGVCFWTWKRRGSSPWLLVGWLWYLVMLAPVVGILQVGEQAHADRYAYLPTIGLFLALAVGLERWIATSTARLKPSLAAGAIVLLVFAGLARAQVAHWQDSGTLYRRSNDVTGGNYQAHLNLGTWLRAEGQLAAALEQTRAAAELRPGAFMVQYNLGVQEQATGDQKAAISAFERALVADDTSADSHNRLGQLKLGLGDTEAAGQHFARAAELEPTRFDLLSNLARFRAATGDLAGAREPFERVLALQGSEMPGEDRLILAHARAGTGAAAGALELLRELRLERPSDPNIALDLAWFLATTDVEGLRSAAEAFQLTGQLITTPGAPRALILPARAAALAASGSFPEAVKAQEELVGLVPEARRPTELVRLALYRQNQALRLSSPW